MIHLVLLSGGSGLRLWPLSNEARSKQFLKVLRNEEGAHVSMVQRVFSQIRAISGDVDITIATGESQRDSILRQLDGDFELVLEPERRDTAAAIMLACAHLAYEQHSSLNDSVIVMPIDTFADQSYYDKISDLVRAVEIDGANLTLLGAEPTYPSSKYGYIVPAEGALANLGLAAPVECFVEKPSVAEAAKLIAKGALWNCGVFAFELKYVLEILASYVNVSSYSELVSRYSELPKNSFDYEVVENAESMAVIPYKGTWKDLGTWNTLTEEMADVSAGRVIGADTCKSTHIINELDLPLMTLGLDDAIVVATHDGILVADKAASSQMKSFVEDATMSRPMYEHRRWGEYRVLDANVQPNDTKSIVKELVIEAGKQLSYQRHKHRTEVWTVISGDGEVALNDIIQHVSMGDVVRIPPGCDHSIRAISELHIIEVQLGSLLEEEDIERFGYYEWNPAS